MKKIGIIGGLAWPSTVDYYRLFCVKTNDHFRLKGAAPPYPTPHMVIESLNVSEMRKLRGREGDDVSWRRYEDVFRATLMRLKDAGAEFGVIASNTPHMRLKGIIKGLDFTVVSILETTALAVQATGGKRALILGTPVTMRSAVYAETFMKYGVSVVPQLSEEEIAQLEKLIDVDLYQGAMASAREKILEICRTHIRERSGDVVCLACTELPLAFPEHQDSADFKIGDIRFVNTTVAHVEAALREALL